MSGARGGEARAPGSRRRAAASGSGGGGDLRRPGSSEALLADGALEARWLGGDATALAEAHRRYRARLERVAYRILRDRADAEDVVQRVFLALPRAAYRGSASLWSYLYRAAVNGALGVLRARGSRRGAEEAAYAQALAQAAGAEREQGPEAQVLEGELLAGVARGLLEVRPQHRRVLVLRIHAGLTPAEIAAQEGLPPATVRTWLRRGREELRRALRPLLREMASGPAPGGEEEP